MNVSTGHAPSTPGPSHEPFTARYSVVIGTKSFTTVPSLVMHVTKRNCACGFATPPSTGGVAQTKNLVPPARFCSARKPTKPRFSVNGPASRSDSGPFNQANAAGTTDGLV